MRRVLQLAILLLCAVPALAQQTPVSATVTDPNGVPYNFATGYASIACPGNQQPTFNNSPVTRTITIVGFDGFGHFAMNLWDVNAIQPTNCGWQFMITWQDQITSFTTGIIGKSNQTPAITGSTNVDLSAAISAFAPPLPSSATGGGVPGGVPIQVQVNRGGSPPHFGGTPCESLTALNTGPVNVDCDWHSKGSNPYVDITRFGAHPCNVSTTPCAGGITANISSGSPTATLSSASTFINGDGVVIYGAGSASGLSTPAAPVVTQVLAQMGVETDLTLADSAAGSTTKCYKIIARTTGGGYTPASPETCTTTGQATLGIVTVNLSSCTRAVTIVTCTTAAATPLLVGFNGNVSGPEVYIGGAAGTIDNSFRGWRAVSSAVDSTHFTFNDLAVNSGNGAPTSTSGGTATFFTANHLSWTAVTGAWLYYIYGGASGAETLIGVSRPSDLGPVNPLAFTTWDDFSNLLQNFTFPSWIPTTPPTVGANNNLSTTILSGSGSTTLTLAASAGATVTNAGIRLDAGPAFVAAAAAANATGVLYIPGGASAGNDLTNFVINNYCDLTPYKLSVVQNGNISVHETLALGGSGLRYSGSTLSSGGTPSTNTWGSFPHFTVFEAVPGMYINNGANNSVRGIQFQFGTAGAAISNGVLLALSETGFDSSFEDDAFITGSLPSDLAGFGLILRGQPGAAIGDTIMDRISLVTGMNSDGASHNTAFFCNNCGTTTIRNMTNIRTGIIFFGNPTSETLSLQYTHYNGGFTPLISSIMTAGTITLGAAGNQIQMDTVGQPCVSSFQGAPAVTNNGCNPSGYFFQSPSVTGSVNLVSGGALLNNSLSTTVQAEVSVGNSVIFNTTGPNGGISVGYNNDSIFVQAAPPAAPSCTVNAGGSVAVGSYQFAVAPNWWGTQSGLYGTNSLLSNVCTTTPGNQTIAITWTIPPGNPKSMHVFGIGVPNNGSISGGATPASFAPGDFPTTTTSASWTSGTVIAPVALNFPHGGATALLPGTQGISSPAWITSGTGGGFSSTATAATLTANRSVTWTDVSGDVFVVPSGTPTCAATGAGTGATCGTFQANSDDVSGAFTISTGTTPAATGTITLTFANSGGGIKYCVFVPANTGLANWNARASFIPTAVGGSNDQAAWDNNAVNLTGSTTYVVQYLCGRH